MRKLLVILVLFLGVAFVILSLSELEQTVETLKRGNHWFLLLALCIQVIWFFLVGLTYRSLYQLLGMHDSIFRLTQVAAAATFINVVMPTAGVGGIALFANAANRQGHPTGKVTLAAALFLLFDMAAFLGVLALGMGALFRRNDLDASEVIAALILLAVASLLAISLYIGSRSVEAMGRFLARLARLVNALLRPFLRREYLREERAYEFAQDMAEGLASLPHRPGALFKPLLLSFLNKTLLIGILLCTFLAFRVPHSPGTIIGGFAMGYLFLVVSPTPAGIGVVEGVLPLALRSLRVAWSQAVVITIAYRAVTFWVPLGIGAWAFRSLHLDQTNEEPA